MRKQKIKIDLYNKPIPTAINDALADFAIFFAWLNKKMDLFIQQLAIEIRNNADSGFAAAFMNDDMESPNVAVTVQKRGNNMVVVARGEDAVWVEFGTGVFHNGGVGTSPHPLGADLGFLIGTYGFGYGARRAWGYYDGGELVITHGTPAQMPLYNAIKLVASQIIPIANKVFI